LKKMKISPSRLLRWNWLKDKRGRSSVEVEVRTHRDIRDRLELLEPLDQHDQHDQHGLFYMKTSKTPE
jgi:hypothetical protein